MYILGLETTGPICSVALMDLENQNEVILRAENEPMGHLKHLTEYTRELMSETGVEMKNVAAVAVSIGPGSFTGIRIGVTTARAISQGLKIPCVGVPTLEMFQEKAEESCVVVPILNARRGQVYGAAFKGNNTMIDPGPYMLVNVLEKLKEYSNLKSAGEIIFYGDGIDSYNDILDKFKEEIEEDTDGKAEIKYATEGERYQRADMVVRYAAKKYAEGETVMFEELLPDYMRKAEAEQKLEDGTLQRMREEKLARLMAGN